MSRPISRRDALAGVTAAGTGLFLTSSQALPQQTPLQWSGKPIELTVASVTPDTARITLQPLDNGQPVTVPNDGALVNDDNLEPVVRLRALTAGRSVRCGSLTVHLSGNPFTIRVAGKGGRLIQEVRPDTAAGKLVFSLGDGPILGLGQGGPQFDKRGNVDRMGSGQGGFRLATHGAKVPVQFVIGASGWAMFIHRPAGSFDFTGGNGVFAPANPDSSLPLDLFVVGAADPVAVMNEFARITGFPEMVPLWSFGYHQSHRTLDSPEQIIQEAKTFREKKLPCDTMIYLGTDFCPNGWNTHNGEFTWNAKAFPDPVAMVRQLHDLDFKVVLHTVVEGRHFTGTVTDPCTAEPLPSGRTSDGR